MASEKDKFLKTYRDRLKRREISDFGCPLLREDFEETNDKVLSGSPVDINPFTTQYDLNVHLMLEYDRYRDYFDGILARDDFFWMAADLRWPTTTNPHGKPDGAMMRNPWAEHIVWAMLNHRLVCLLGGSGQGKTRTPMALFQMVWDHYAMTPTGARFCFSSTNKDKLSRAAWANLADLYRNSRQDVGKYCKVGVIRNSMQIKRQDYAGKNEVGGDRHYSTDGKGIMEGVLIGGSANSPQQAQARVDKMTGSHVPTAMGFLLDEYQSMPVSPMTACYNLATHPRHVFIVCAGNPNMEDDELGKQAEPRDGYGTVSPQDTNWMAEDDKGRKAYVIHLNNDHSPGMRSPKKYWYMPTAAKRESVYPAGARDSMEYFRFWTGWFVPDSQSTSIITASNLETTGARREFIADTSGSREVVNCLSFDSASESIDRSIALHFQIGVEKDTNLHVLNFVKIHRLAKTRSATYYEDTARELVDLCVELRVASEDIIIDNTGSHGMDEQLMRFGRKALAIKYQWAPSDLVIDYSTRKIASRECVNCRAEMCMLLERFIINGQVRGITEEFCPNWKREICSLRWGPNDSKDRKQAEDKAVYKSRMGQSPDVFDTMIQAAYHARNRHGIVPGAIGDRREYRRDNDKYDIFKMNETFETELDFASL